MGPKAVVTDCQTGGQVTRAMTDLRDCISSLEMSLAVLEKKSDPLVIHLGQPTCVETPTPTEARSDLAADVFAVAGRVADMVRRVDTLTNTLDI